MHAKQPASSDVSDALNQQYRIPLAGDTKIGDQDYPIKLDISPRARDRWVRGAIVFSNDGEQECSPNRVQTSVVRTNVSRSAPSHDHAERPSFDADAGGRAAESAAADSLGLPGTVASPGVG